MPDEYCNKLLEYRRESLIATTVQGFKREPIMSIVGLGVMLPFLPLAIPGEIKELANDRKNKKEVDAILPHLLCRSFRLTPEGRTDQKLCESELTSSKIPHYTEVYYAHTEPTVNIILYDPSKQVSKSKIRDIARMVTRIED